MYNVIYHINSIFVFERIILMNNNTPATNGKSGSNAFLIPIFGAVALIITCAVYIIYKLAQQQVAEKWADYDECGWS